MYLLSWRLAPSPCVGTRSSGTAQYTVPSVSTQTVTPRRVGFLACAWAPPRAEPAGPSVWCTMMLRQGWALASSPHGASQTTFSPGISGVPETRAIAARSGASADAGARVAATHRAHAARGVLAANLQHPAGDHCALGQRRGGQQDAELIAAGARQDIAGPQPGLRHQGEMLQAGVARGMAAAVVDRLEAVEIDHQ